jgi:segregation and condensation protein B
MASPTTQHKVLGILFYKSAPVTKAFLRKTLSIAETEFAELVHTLKNDSTSWPFAVVDSGEALELVTKPELAPTIELLKKNDLNKDIGKAGSETLAIILYKGPITRSEIDRIRGVNSSYILRNLLIRDLIVRTTTKNKPVQYNPTTTLLNYLGITNKKALPGYEEILSKLYAFEQNNVDESI